MHMTTQVLAKSGEEVAGSSYGPDHGYVHPTRKEGCVARCPSLLRHAAVTLTVKGCFSVKRVLPYKLMVREVRHKQAWCGYITCFCFKALGVKW